MLIALHLLFIVSFFTQTQIDLIIIVLAGKLFYQTFTQLNQPQIDYKCFYPNLKTCVIDNCARYHIYESITWEKHQPVINCVLREN